MGTTVCNYNAFNGHSTHTSELLCCCCWEAEREEGRCSQHLDVRLNCVRVIAISNTTSNQLDSSTRICQTSYVGTCRGSITGTVSNDGEAPMATDKREPAQEEEYPPARGHSNEAEVEQLMIHLGFSYTYFVFWAQLILSLLKLLEPQN